MRLGSRLLEHHHTGADVLELTKKLKMLGHLKKEREDFHLLVHTVVERFQHRAGIDVDGVVGPQTLGALEAYNGPQEVYLSDLPSILYRNPDSDLGLRALQRALYYLSMNAQEEGSNNAGEDVAHFHSVVLEKAGNHTGDWCQSFALACIEEALGEEIVRDGPWISAIIHRLEKAGLLFWTKHGAEVFRYHMGKYPENVVENVMLKAGDMFYTQSWGGKNPRDLKNWNGYPILGHTGLVHHQERKSNPCDPNESALWYSIEGNRGNFPSQVGPWMRTSTTKYLFAYARF